MNFNDDKVVESQKKLKKLSKAEQMAIDKQKANETPTKYVIVPQRNLWKLLSEFIFTTTPYPSIEELDVVKKHR